jgi:periplasmic protein TonB
MKTNLLILVFLAASLTFAQDVLQQSKESTLDGQPVYVIVDFPPKYFGGEKMLEKFIQDNIAASVRSRDSKVFYTVIIDKYGIVREPQLQYGKNPQQVKEALRIIRLMPRWVPGRLKGKNVYVRVPLKFDFGIR